MATDHKLSEGMKNKLDMSADGSSSGKVEEENVGYVYMRVVMRRGSHSLEIVLAVVVLDCKYVLLSH